MKRLSLFLLCLICNLRLSAQADSLKAIHEIKVFRAQLNKMFKERNTSPLTSEDFANFQGHNFFPIDLSYRVLATLTVTEGTPFFAMKTSTARTSTERIYGYVSFKLRGKDFRMPVYQSQDLMNSSEYANYLFFPFSDQTNGTQTYGAGRYIDLQIPKEGNSITIDFNMAYNPYCAYNKEYSCPLIPDENKMDIEVPVGVWYLEHDDKKPSENNIVYTDSEVPPEFPGGYQAMLDFFSRNMHYPEKVITGTVYVQFVVNADGKITDVTTIRKLSPECDREAERVIWMMPKWKPGTRNGENVAVRFVMPFKFNGR